MTSYASLLALIEADLDAHYHRQPLPHQNRIIATWYFLTVLEDNQRWLLVLPDDSQASNVEVAIDRMKYSAKFALKRIQKECIDTSKAILPDRVTPKTYLKAGGLLMAGVDFMAATQLCSAAHLGSVTFLEKIETIEVDFDERHHDKRYAALEFLGYLPDGAGAHVGFLYTWAKNSGMRPPILREIAQSVRIVKRQVVYQYQTNFAVRLASELEQPPFLIPAGWRFPWGGREQTTLLINALCVRCVYHFVAVHFGASEHGHPGRGEASILLVLSRDQLVHDIMEMSSLPGNVIRSFVQCLTFGYKMKAPDPALQPLVPLGDGRMAIPAMLFLSSNHERNLLSLQARIEPSEFNVMSRLFERDMVSDLLKKIRPRWEFTKDNVTVRVGGEFEEIDLLIADPSSKTLLICELRWMLGPGDPREVQNRKKVCWEKVDQLCRKVKWVRFRIEAVLEKQFEMEGACSHDWQVDGVVVIKSFGGAFSTQDEFPIMRDDLFSIGMTEVASLAQFATWSQSLEWLPQEGVHFQIHPREEEHLVCGKRLVSQGLERLATRNAYEDFVRRTLRV